MARQLTIGDREVTIPALNGFKTVRAGRLVAEAGECLPQVQEAIAGVRENTPDLVLTPELAKLPRFQRTVNGERVPIFTDADFEAAGGTITLPQQPQRQDMIVAVFPVVFKHAERQLVELLALVTIPNDQLRQADEAGTVDQVLADAGRRLLHEASIGQLLALVTAAIEQVSEALAGDDLERAVGAVTGRVPAPTNPDPAPVNLTETPPSTPESLTASPAPTGGPEQTVSTAPPGTRFES